MADPKLTASEITVQARVHITTSFMAIHSGDRRSLLGAQPPIWQSDTDRAFSSQSTASFPNSCAFQQQYGVHLKLSYLSLCDPLDSKQDVAFQLNGVEREKPAAGHWAGLH